MHALSLAHDYDSRKRLIDETQFPWFGGHFDEIRLPGFLSNSVPHLSGGSQTAASFAPLGTYTAEQLQSLAQGTAWGGMDDVNTLPVHLWLHAHFECHPSRTVNVQSNMLLRDAEYVFWDGLREETSLLLQRLSEHTWAYEGRLPTEELADRLRAMERSWATRTAVYLKHNTPRRWPGNMPGW
jgi:hypothetical protein